MNAYRKRLQLNVSFQSKAPSLANVHQSNHAYETASAAWFHFAHFLIRSSAVSAVIHFSPFPTQDQPGPLQIVRTKKGRRNLTVGPALPRASTHATAYFATTNYIAYLITCSPNRSAGLLSARRSVWPSKNRT